jgi:hypothetical protein
MLADLHAFGQSVLIKRMSIKMQQMFWMDLNNKESARMQILLHQIAISSPNVSEIKQLKINYPFKRNI